MVCLHDVRRTVCRTLRLCGGVWHRCRSGRRPGQTTILSTAPQYKGETTVTPRTYEETRLETKDKLMPDDVTVRKIPRYEVSNDCGGVTLIMGDEYFNG